MPPMAVPEAVVKIKDFEKSRYCKIDSS